MATIIEMPKLSDTMTVGTLVNWLKKEGDKVSSGDMLAEVETDKATMELENFEDGILLRHFIKVGDQVPVGTPICAIGSKGEVVEAPARSQAPAPTPAAAPAPAAPPPAAPAPAPTAAPASPAPTTQAPPKPVFDPTRQEVPQPFAPSTAPVAASPAPSATSATGNATGRLPASPLARRIAGQLGVDLAAIKGSGPGGRIVKADVEAAARALRPPATPAAAAPEPAAPSPRAEAAGTAPAFTPTGATPVQEERFVTASNMRATIARRLVESKTQIPHFYLEVEVDAAPALALRDQLLADLGTGAKVSVNDLILKASAVALRKVPAVNSSWTGQGIQYHAAAHVSFAVAIEDGLITPVVRDCHAKSLFQIGAEARQLARLAKDRKLKPEQFTGGTFCVSNLGMMGVERFSAIINPPNAAILAVGATVRKPVVLPDGTIGVGHRLSLTLSCDHRVVDGATGALFLGALKESLEKPLNLLA